MLSAEISMSQTSTLARATLLVVLGLSTSGCELVGGIFKAGMWVGALVVIFIVVLVMVAVSKLKR